MSIWELFVIGFVFILIFGSRERSEVMKIFVQSLIELSEQQLLDYAEGVSDRTENLSPLEFVKKIKQGEKIIVEFPDKTRTAYELVIENN